MEDNFVWTDELVREFALEVKVNGQSDWVTNQMGKFKKSKQPILDYEILSLKYLKDNKIYPFTSMPDENFTIHSVKRLSDNEVFTIGDKVNYGEIEKFYIGWAGMEVHFTDGCGATLRSIESNKKKPLFTTEDNVPIYEGDEYWYIYPQWIIGHITISRSKIAPIIATFSTKEKANEYVLMNKPCLSVNDFRSCQTDVEHLNKNTQYNKLLELAKQKINGTK